MKQQRRDSTALRMPESRFLLELVLSLWDGHDPCIVHEHIDFPAWNRASESHWDRAIGMRA